jgi:hypothetical protein
MHRPTSRTSGADRASACTKIRSEHVATQAPQCVQRSTFILIATSVINLKGIVFLRLVP